VGIAIAGGAASCVEATLEQGGGGFYKPAVWCFCHPCDVRPAQWAFSLEHCAVACVANINDLRKYPVSLDLGTGIVDTAAAIAWTVQS
jgi:hypothetical protein